MTVLLYLTITYSLILLILLVGLFKSYLIKKTNQINNKLSVIIAAKNEQKNIISLLQALAKQNYPKDNYEVIIADDNSTDETAEIVKTFIKDNENFKYIHVTDRHYPEIKGKKKALTAGIAQSKYSILVFTDADCLPKENWLQSINRNFTDDVDFVAGYSPLLFDDDSLLGKLKNLERSSIFAVTAGSFGLNIPLTCTARNMAYRKSLWEEVNGFIGIHDVLSGDDDLMLLKSRHHIRKYRFCFDLDSVVESNEHKTGNQHLNQEIRRASKFKYYPLYIKLLTVFIAVYYLYFLSTFLQVILSTYNFNHLIINIILKIGVEALFLIFFLSFVKRLKLMLYFPLAELLYITYFLYFGVKGSLSKYTWKK